MLTLDVPAVGRRIAHYRKLDGLTAEELAGRAGHGLNRSIVANLEAGRRQDVGVQQIFAIAWALQVPPVALLFDLGNPDRSVVAEESGEEAISVLEAVSWEQGWRPARATAAGRQADRLLGGLRLVQFSRERRVALEAEVATQPRDRQLAERLELARAEEQATIAMLRGAASD